MLADAVFDVVVVGHFPPPLCHWTA
jgi:hypothetical protein